MIDPHLLSAHLFRELTRHPTVMLLQHISFVALFSLYVYPEVPDTQYFVWLGLVAIASTWSWHVSQRHSKHVKTNVSAQQLDSLTMASIALGLSFGFVALFLPILSFSSKAFVLFMLSAFAASELLRLSALPSVFGVFLVALIAPLILVLPSIQDEMQGWKLIPPVVLMAGALYYSAVQRRRDLTDDLIARFSLENDVGQDKLTGIANRRRFDLVLEQMWAQARRNGVPVSVILIDIDQFKKYNDFYGHQEGDKCLAAVAKALDGSAQRASDLVARYGGEEFVILLNQTPRDFAYQIAEEMRKAVEKLNIPHEKSEYGKVTISVGGVTLFAKHDHTQDNPVKLADMALYRAKNEGRNRVIWHQSSVSD